MHSKCCEKAGQTSSCTDRQAQSFEGKTERSLYSETADNLKGESHIEDKAEVAS